MDLGESFGEVVGWVKLVRTWAVDLGESFGEVVGWVKLVRTWAVDLGESFGEVVGWGFGGGQGLPSGLDGDCAVAACGAHEFLDAPTGLGLNPVTDREGGEHDA